MGIHCIYIRKRFILAYVEECLFDGKASGICIDNVHCGWVRRSEESNRCNTTMLQRNVQRETTIRILLLYLIWKDFTRALRSTKGHFVAKALMHVRVLGMLDETLQVQCLSLGTFQTILPLPLTPSYCCACPLTRSH